MRLLLTMLLLISLVYTAWADRLFVRNKPFQGYVLGTAQDIRGLEIDIADLCRSLGFKLEVVQGNWVVLQDPDDAIPKVTPGAHHLWVAGEEFPYRTESGRNLVRLGDFADKIEAILKHNRELGIVDLNLSSRKSAQAPKGPDLRTHRVLYFGADWAPASKLFLPVMEEFERKHLMPVVFVDCTQPRSANYKNNIQFFQGNAIPYTVLVSPAGKVVKTWTGYQELGVFTTEVLKLTK